MSEPALPPIGTRWRFPDGRTAHRTYELAERVTRDEAIKRGQHGCDRNRLVLVEEVGHRPEYAVGVGWAMYVEDRWFETRAASRVRPQG